MQTLENIHSWVFYTKHNNDLSIIQRDINNLFSEYSFYPEIDWNKYGYHPPDGYQVLGGWRHPLSRSFVFLLDNPYMVSVEPNAQVILYVFGEDTELKRIENRLGSFKLKYEIEDRKEAIGLQIEERLQKFKLSRSFKIFSIVLVIFTTIVNAFSLYIRQLPPPDIKNLTIIDTYTYFLTLIHFSALILLFLVILFVGIILVKFSYLTLKKL